ncbi:MAG: hypothetical protein CMJ52_05615 [Planctomycetaceae bacterium]|nr:hypothetical protein [Planctomycetaceae bacterium]
MAHGRGRGSGFVEAFREMLQAGSVRHGGDRGVSGRFPGRADGAGAAVTTPRRGAEAGRLVGRWDRGR